VEKPLALDPPAAADLVRRAVACQRILMVGHVLRFHPAFLRLCALHADGTFGRLQRIHSSRLNLGAIRTHESALWCLAPHDVSMILALTGEMPATVEGFLEPILPHGPAGAATFRLGFASGPSAMVQVSWLHPIKEHRLAVVGTDAMAVFDDTLPPADKLRIFRHRVRPDGTVERAEPESVPLPEGEPLKEQARHFLQAVATGTAPLTDGAEALRVMDVLARVEALGLARPAPDRVRAPA
jgi:UDP-2-acetamido-3-amino-2,3-dideoxy-glucuronate N-acetyltransferase